MADSTPAMPGTRASAVALQLRRMILSGELPLGTRLRQVEISERFGVSTTPVREAFTVLAREGLVQQDVHRGVKVVLPSQSDLEETYEMRMLLEPMAAGLAAANIEAEELAELNVQLKRMKAVLSAHPTSAEEVEDAEANRAFHKIISDASRRPRLAEVVEQLRNSADIFVRISVAHPPVSYRKQADREHAAILKALRAGDGKLAEEKMRGHLEHSYRQISKSLADLAGGDAS